MIALADKQGRNQDFIIIMHAKGMQEMSTEDTRGPGVCVCVWGGGGIKNNRGCPSLAARFGGLPEKMLTFRMTGDAS